MKKSAAIFSLFCGVMLITILTVSVRKPWGKRTAKPEEASAVKHGTGVTA